jgi:hypothetical protein
VEKINSRLQAWQINQRGATMAKLKKMHRDYWAAQHQKRQSDIMDKLETGEIDELHAEYLDDLDNQYQEISIRSWLFSFQN